MGQYFQKAGGRNGVVALPAEGYTLVTGTGYLGSAPNQPLSISTHILQIHVFLTVSVGFNHALLPARIIPQTSPSSFPASLPPVHARSQAHEGFAQRLAEGQHVP